MMQAPIQPVITIVSPRAMTDTIHPEAGSIANIIPTRLDGTYFWHTV